MTSYSSNGHPSRPLRPYYTPSSDENVAFVATAPPRGTPQTPASNSSSGVYAMPSSSNRYAAANDDALLNEAAGIAADGAGTISSLRDWARLMALSAAFSYTSTCLAMPFEVGKLLLQVQWVPRDDVWRAFGEMEREDEMVRLGKSKSLIRTGSPTRRSVQQQSEQDGGVEDDNEEEELLQTTGTAADWASDGAEEGADVVDELDDPSDEESANAYFQDQANRPTRPTAMSRASYRRKKRSAVDSSGYVKRKSIHEDNTRPEFVMPIVVRGGVWEMIKAVGRGKEGWLGLWKGSFTTFVIDSVTSTVQPIVSFILSFIAPSALTPLPLPYAPHPYRSLTLLLSSHLITGIIVSPLDLVRTRLIAQSTLENHRKYTSPWNALFQILNEEGGWRTVYFHPNLFIPTVLDFTIRPLLSLGSPLFIEHRLRLDPITSPVRYSFAEFCISNFSLLITLPIETVRRRLQLQARAAWGKKIAKLHGSRPKPSHRSSLSSGSSSMIRADANKAADPTTPSRTSPEYKEQRSAYLASVTGAIPQPIFTKPLKTCVETRPKPYEGVAEAIYRILTEETSTTPVKKITTAANGSKQRNASEGDLGDSGILAKPGWSSFGGLYSLYRGLGFSIGANALVFVLSIVTGERAHATAGWTEI